MKVGTDGVLLGAWVNLNSEDRTVLDVGAGTGLIALQLAQRYPDVVVTAIEKDPDAALQCTENLEASKWAARLVCLGMDFGEMDVPAEPFDAVVSNPPFFIASSTSGTRNRDLARMADHLPPAMLLSKAFECTRPGGSLSLIWPMESLEAFQAQANRAGWFLHRLTRVRGREETPFKRALMEWRKSPPVRLANHILTLEKERQVYTEAYIALVRDFYLLM